MQDLSHEKYDKVRSMSYVALDFPDWKQARRLVDEFGSAVDGYKVGLELFHRAGYGAVEELCRQGKRVFLDIKLHDIPNTVAGALRAVCELPIEMVNVHAFGGRKMMERARETVAQAPHQPLLVAVTVLTSLEQTDLKEIGLDTSPENEVQKLVQLTDECGLDGVVASALEINVIRHMTRSGFEIVVPGTRPKGVSQHDQARTLTPGEAAARGATRLVLGRSVTQAEHPITALQAIWDEMIEVSS
ncbi:orotidine-5'-phosphate decarboxylase [Alicyclobacillus sp. SO9]|nr:orotidine-5'-phosphate decarboxylase [Alicyclobacillus sp. SO9]